MLRSPDRFFSSPRSFSRSPEKYLSRAQQRVQEWIEAVPASRSATPTTFSYFFCPDVLNFIAELPCLTVLYASLSLQAPIELTELMTTLQAANNSVGEYSTGLCACARTQHSWCCLSRSRFTLLFLAFCLRLQSTYTTMVPSATDKRYALSCPSRRV